MNSEQIENDLNQGLDYIIHQLTKGNTIDGLENGRVYIELEQVKEWRSKYGYQFHIYSNDHLIENKPHFHLIKKAENIDCRFFFDGDLIDCKREEKLSTKTKDALKYFLKKEERRKSLVDLWNSKNSKYQIS